VGLYDRDYMREPREPQRYSLPPRSPARHSQPPRYYPARARRWRYERRPSDRWLQLLGALLLVNLVVLPHVTIAGRHWTLWFF
jgi:hypothetical protein